MRTQEDFLVRKETEIGVFLNKVQKEAVLHTEGALLLLASPGSGKTTTMIMRIGYLIEEKGVNPSRIKAVTFSRASALDMKERFKSFFPALPSNCVDFSTIHSLAFAVIRDDFYQNGRPYQLIEGEGNRGEQGRFNGEQAPLHKKLILRHLFTTLVGENITDDQMDELTTYISFIKNKMMPKEEWSQVSCDVPQAEQILRQYEEFKQSGSDKLLVDYDDMLTLANEALETNPQLLRKYQGMYDYVMTDESQDTSKVQHAIIEKLVRAHGNLCVVADEDQSIYTWRAAEPQYLLNFKQVYPDASILMMEQNYRSSKDIVDVANRFIKRNKDRYNKNMFTENPPHEPITGRSFPDYKKQAKYLVKEISDVAQLQDVAIIYRNNSSSIILMNEFDRVGIPFYMKDTDNRFFSHWVVEDILNFMRMTFTDKRPDILEKIHTKFNGYITRQQMEALKQIHNRESVFDNLIQHVEIKEYQKRYLLESKETFQQMKGMPPLHAIRIIRNKLGYEKALEKMCERLGFRKEYLMGILNTLEEIADTLNTMEEFAARLNHLKSVMKTSRFKKNDNVVTFSTFHSAKGLEFNRVYMIDLVEGVIPSKDDIKEYEKGNSAPMEEAVRLFYVGMTRAKSHLELLSYQEKDGVKVEESQFITDIRNMAKPSEQRQKKEIERKKREKKSLVEPNPNAIKNLTELKVGNEVKHRVFGQGEIIHLSKESIEIRFQTGNKKLAIDLCLEMGLLEPA